MAGGSLTERHDAHQHGAASARQLDALTFENTGKVPAAPLLEVEGIEDGRRVTVIDHQICPDEHGQRFGEQRVSWASH